MKTAAEKRENRLFTAILILVALLFIVALSAPLIAPNDPDETDLANALAPPGEKYPLGTDGLGRCMLSRVLYGARVSIFSGLVITLAVLAVGVAVGVISGYFGGAVDAVLSKLIVTVQAFPKIILAIAIAGLMGAGIIHTVLALCLVEWVEYARIARSLAAGERSRTYISAARICGETHFRIIFKRIIPNIIRPLIVDAGMGIASVIMEIAALSYLGVGVREPMAEWGAMINAGRDYMQTDIRLVLIPGIAVFITAAIFNLFGEKLRDKMKVS